MINLLYFTLILWGRPGIVFHEELRFGSVEDDFHYIWPSLETSLDVDERGHIFVVDVSERHSHAYTIETLADDENQVVRYRVEIPGK